MASPSSASSEHSYMLDGAVDGPARRVITEFPQNRTVLKFGESELSPISSRVRIVSSSECSTVDWEIAWDNLDRFVAPDRATRADRSRAWGAPSARVPPRARVSGAGKRWRLGRFALPTLCVGPDPFQPFPAHIDCLPQKPRAPSAGRAIPMGLAIRADLDVYHAPTPTHVHSCVGCPLSEFWSLVGCNSIGKGMVGTRPRQIRPICPD